MLNRSAVRLALLWETISASYWLVPTLALLGSGVLALSLVALDRNQAADTLHGLWWVFGGGAEGARTVLATVAGSVITVAGVTFSITIAVLSLTSSQFGPRLLRGFLRDKVNQMVLGAFLGTFLYCLLVLRTVRSVEEDYFVPHIAVTGGVLLAIVSVCMLVFFIHHVTQSIQISHIIEVAAQDLSHAIESVFPERMNPRNCAVVLTSDDDPAEEGLDASLLPGARQIISRTSGYVQAIDDESLMALAKEGDLVIWINYRPGQFVTRGAALAHVVTARPDPLRRGEVTHPRDEDLTKQLNDFFVLGDQRTMTQDIEFLIQQLAEIAVRALSPGINDPFTAVMCLDRLGAGLINLSERRAPSRFRHDENGILRVVTPILSYAETAEACFGGIRRYGQGDAQVMRRLLETIGAVAATARTAPQGEALAAQAARARQAALESLPPGDPVEPLEAAYRNAMHALRRPSPP